MELLLIIITLGTATLISYLTNNRGLIEIIAVGATAIAAIFANHIAFVVAVTGVYTYVPYINIDALSALAIFIIGNIGFMTTIYSVFYLRKETEKKIIGFHRVQQYFMLSNLFLAAMFLAVSASNPIFAWISIEATTLSTAFLISFYNKPSAMEAAWKYLVINSTGLLLGFFGTLLYFTASTTIGDVALTNWNSLVGHADVLDPTLAKVAFVFVLIGYGTKAGFSPMHTWLPDAHSKAPAPISALLSGVLLNVAFVVILKFKLITDTAIGSAFSSEMLFIVGSLSVTIAAFIILRQKNYKRLLAYSSIENMGIIALGFAFGGIGIFASLLHMIYNAFTKSAFFLVAGNIFLTYSTTKIPKVRNMLTILPITAVLVIVSLLSITSIPPFGTFLTKMYILSAGVHTYGIVVFLLLIPLTLVVLGFFRHITTMLNGTDETVTTPVRESIFLILPPALLLVCVFYFSFTLPSFITTLIQDTITIYAI